jgi:glycosyltransferase involved in cell wall biosynthesis
LRIALVTLGDPTRLTGGYLYHRRLAELAPRHGARIDFVSFPPWPFPLPRLAARRVGRRLAALPADVVLLDSIAAAYYRHRSERGMARRPLVAILHQPPGGIGHGRLRTAVQTRLDARAYHPASLLLTASASLAAEVARAGLPPGKLRVVPPGCDVAAGAEPAAAPPTRAGLRAGRAAAFLCVANWLEHKGILDLLEAFAALPAGAATLHLAGDEDADARYGARVRARLSHDDLAGRVVRHGKLGRGDVAALYRAADVFALPSRRESYGTVYGEALAAGLPVVGWHSGNLPYLVTDGVEGLVVAADDVSALAGALTRLATDEALRLRLGAGARRRGAALPTWDDATARVVEALREVVAAHREGSR